QLLDGADPGLQGAMIALSLGLGFRRPSWGTFSIGAKTTATAGSGRDASHSPPPCGEEYEVGVVQDGTSLMPTTPTLYPSPSISGVPEIDHQYGKSETSDLLGGGTTRASREIRQGRVSPPVCRTSPGLPLDASHG